MTGKVLTAKNISVRYGASQVLFDAEIEIGHGEFVSLLGRNGMGKTTFVKALMGMKSIESGSVFFCGQQVAGKPDYVIARLGMGIVPEGRGIFPNLSVNENLVATAMKRKGSMSTICTNFSLVCANESKTWAAIYQVESSRCWPSGER